jgi:hypothetical protein
VNHIICLIIEPTVLFIIYRGNVVVEDRPSVVVGRSMSETDAISSKWTENCNDMVDEVWIPTEFHR